MTNNYSATVCEGPMSSLDPIFSLVIDVEIRDLILYQTDRGGMLGA